LPTQLLRNGDLGDDPLRLPGYHLAPYLNDPNWRVRYFILETLGKLNYGKFRDALREAIEKDPHKSVRIAAILLILSNKGNADDVSYLQALKEKNKNDEKMLKAIDYALAKLSSRK
jgi:hypothetical protein